jgi:EmrB/QacA subfamily drug resistance transporter
MSEFSQRQAVLITTCAGAFITPFAASSINIALPAIGKWFGLNAVALSWVATSYLLAAAMFLGPFGKLADIYGRKRVYYWGLLITTFASLCAGIAPVYQVLIVFRVLQGIGAAMVFGTGLAILASAFPAPERGKILGINVAATYLGLSLGPVVGGLLTTFWGWQSVFLINVPVGIFILILQYLKVKPEQVKANKEGFDLRGSLFYGVGLAALMYGFSIIPSVFGFFLVLCGIAFLILFYFYEVVVVFPVLNMNLFRKNSVFTLSIIAALINYSTTFAVGFLLSLYLQYTKEISPRNAGLILFVQPLVMAFCSPVAGKLSDRIEPWIIASLGLALNTLGLLFLIFINQSTSINFIYLCLVVLGVGISLFSSPNTSAAMGSVDHKDYGVASATIGTMRLLGQMFSLGISTLVFALVIGHVPITPVNYHKFLYGIKIAFIIFTLISVPGIFASAVRGKIHANA